MGAISQLHGVALWFDCRFPGSQRQVFLSTAPHAPLTHWYQARRREG
jgi:histone-arginine methyltransferase CARM1